MIKKNDYIIYGGMGVCQIIDIEQDENDPDKEYYVLKRIQGNLNIKTPVHNNKVAIRHIVTEDEVNQLIDEMPDMESIWIKDIRQRGLKYKEILKSGECHELLQVMKTLYDKDQEKTDYRKGLTLSDKDILQTAQTRLYEEFSFALQIPSDEVEDYIQNRIS